MKKEGKSENNWGSFDCGKILYWNEVPVITYCAALTSTGGKGGEWRQFGTKLSPSETQQSFLQAGKLLLNALGVPTLLCEPVCPAQLCCPGSANREMFMGDREAFCMETVQQGWVWQWQRGRAGFDIGRERGRAGFGSGRTRDAGEGCVAVWPGWHWRSALRCRKRPLQGACFSTSAASGNVSVLQQIQSMTCALQCWLDLFNSNENAFFKGFFFEAAVAHQWCSDCCLTGLKVDLLSF